MSYLNGIGKLNDQIAEKHRIINLLEEDIMILNPTNDKILTELYDSINDIENDGILYIGIGTANNKDQEYPPPIKSVRNNFHKMYRFLFDQFYADDEYCKKFNNGNEIIKINDWLRYYQSENDKTYYIGKNVGFNPEDNMTETVINIIELIDTAVERMWDKNGLVVVDYFTGSDLVYFRNLYKYLYEQPYNNIIFGMGLGQDHGCFVNNWDTNEYKIVIDNKKIFNPFYYEYNPIEFKNKFDTSDVIIKDQLTFIVLKIHNNIKEIILPFCRRSYMIQHNIANNLHELTIESTINSVNVLYDKNYTSLSTDNAKNILTEEINKIIIMVDYTDMTTNNIVDNIYKCVNNENAFGGCYSDYIKSILSKINIIIK